MDRIVALKLIRSGELASQQEIERFHAEARAVARLNHPGIVTIHGVGMAGGQHFFSMEYVEGCTLGALIRERPMQSQRAATYVRQIAEAIGYAHLQRVLHRDLKPSNILVDTSDQPHVTDFGLAKREDVQLTIEDGSAIVGTPSYMPPEQIDHKFGAVGPASDVYSLGTMLYELVVGRPPFIAASPLETMIQATQSEPPAPRLINTSIDRDIDTICMKCLEKDPRRRYATANLLADDLRRFLAGEPILARPISSTIRLWRACKKRPALSLLSVLVGFLLVVIAVANSWHAAKQEALRAIAEHQRAVAETRTRIATSHRLAMAAKAASGENLPRAILLASEALQVSLRAGEPHVPTAEKVLRDLLAVSGGPPLAKFRGHAQIVAFSPDSRWIAATMESDNTLRLWDTVVDPTRVPPQLLRGHLQQISAAVFGPDSSWLASADWGGTICFWMLANRVQPPRILHSPSAIHLLTVSPDGRWLLTAGSDPFATLWSTPSSAHPGREKRLLGHSDRVGSIAISPDNHWAATAGAEGTILLWDLTADEPSQHPKALKSRERGAMEVRFSSDGR